MATNDRLDTVTRDGPTRTRERILARRAARLRPEPGPADRARTSVFVVDDQAIVRTGIRVVLEEHGGFVVVGEASDAARALDDIVRIRPDIAIMDLRLPGGDGLEVIREVRARGCPTRCLVLTTFPDEATLFQAVVAGAFGYLLKEAPLADLLDACCRVADGVSLLDPATLGALRGRIRQAPADDDLLARLSPQERRILQFVAEGMTNREIGGHLELAEKTVRNYVSNLLIRMGMKNRTMAAAYVAQYAARAAARDGRVP